MRHSSLHRTLSVLAGLSLLLTAVPSHAAAPMAEGPLTTCSVSDDAPASHVGTTDAAAPVATATRADLSGHGMPCEPGPCSMPIMSCAAGACLSVATPPGGVLSTLPSGLSGAPDLGAENGPSSAPSGILTPPPRG